jgi:hypothetical protein
LTWEVVLEPKAKSAHVFDFNATASSAGTAPASPPAADSRGPDTSSSGLRIPAFVSLGVGAVGLGLGGYFAWQSADSSSQSDKAFACNSQPSGCTDDQRAVVRGFEDDSNAAKTRAIVAFSAGGAVAITGVVLLVLSGHSSNDEKPQASIQPWLGYRAVGVTGSF